VYTICAQLSLSTSDSVIRDRELGWSSQKLLSTYDVSEGLKEIVV